MYGWRIAMFGLGVLVGAIGATALSSRPSRLKDGAATVLSHGMAVKRKAQTVVETARENIEDLVAEADQKLAERQAAPVQE
ncbi:hypothetical protein C4J81_02840 [Deltaproteobacteria bacterium Smac51]|nr:hypothetical protein C4J81_02840 [Deltaproteobacteria bacterium Smac51]